MDFPKWRQELNLLKESGYAFTDPSAVVSIFENKISQWTGAPYAVAVDCATHALELSLRYTGPWSEIHIPKHTYLSVPQTLKKLSAQVRWSDSPWQGVYRLAPTPVVDASLRLTQNMYEPGTFTCLSFQIKKHLPIGRGGMILTDDKKAYEWLKKAVYDGRTPETIWKTDTITQMGFHYYMTPEDAARGLLLFDHHFKNSENFNKDLGGDKDYPNLTEMDYFKRINEWK